MNMTPVAQAVQRQGRGRDTMLVHMTPKEVGGLQALAMQHGGSLTINPQTGLPEAGFLEAILPTLAGAALTIGSGGVINPYMSAAIVGGIQTARTGDVGQGLLAGLGAFGGAGIGTGLTAAGAGAAAPGAGAAGTTTATAAPTAAAAVPTAATTPAEIAAATGGEAAVVAGAPPVIPDPSVFPNATVTTPGGDVTYARAYTGPTAAVPDASSATFSGAEGVDAATNANFPAGTNVNPTTPTTPPTPTIGQNFSQAGQGVKNIFTEEGFDKFVGEAAVKADPSKGIAASPATGLGGGSSAITKAGLAAAPALFDIPEYKPPEEEVSNYKGPYKPSARQVSYPDEEKRRQTSEFTYFTPSNPIPYAEGGETSGLSAVGSSISPSEAQVYQNIANVQRLAGIPAIDTSQFAVAPSRGYEQFVYNPIQAGPARGSLGPEIDYGVAPLMSQEEAKEKTAVAAARGGLGPIGFIKRQIELEGSPGLKAGGSVPTLETGGFVLTKKAVDGLGKGSNKKGQANAQRGLGAIPIKGPGTGTSDSIKTSIDKKRPALVSNGEAYVPKRQVAKKGGAKAFYALMKQAEKAADKRRRA
jgi:hypothetical protein